MEAADLSKKTTASLGTLADLLGGSVIGDADLTVDGVEHPARASDRELALALEKSAVQALAGSAAAAAVVATPMKDAAELGRLKGYLVVDRPRVALAKLLGLFAPAPRLAPGIHGTAVVDPEATVGDGVSIGAYAVVGSGTVIGPGTRIFPHATIGADVTIGRDAAIHAGARIGDRVSLGDRVIVQSNAVIGSDGFGYVTASESTVEAAYRRRNLRSNQTEGSNDEILRIASAGTVVIEDDVEIGAATTIDRATLGATRIGRGTKIDNLVQIAHNCEIGQNCMIAGQVGLSGSVRVGDRTVLAGQVGIADHKTIGSDCLVIAGSGVGGSIPDRAVYGGYPARPKEETLRDLANIRRVPTLMAEIDALKSRLADLEAAGSGDRPEAKGGTGV